MEATASMKSKCNALGKIKKVTFQNFPIVEKKKT